MRIETLPVAALTRRKALAAIAASLGTAGGPPSRAAAGSDSAALRSIADRYFAEAMDQNPFWASSFGIATPRQASAMQMDIAPDQQQRMRALSQRTLAQLDRLRAQTLPDADRLLHAVLEFQCRDDLASLAFPWPLLPLDQMAQSVPFQLADPVANGLSALATADEFKSHLDRLNQLPDWCDQAVANLHEGVRTGVVQPAVILERLLPMLRGLADGRAYLEPLDRWPDAITGAQREALRRDYERCVRQRVAPAMAHLVYVVEHDVLPRGRAPTGWVGLPNGKAWYAQCIRSQTTSDVTAAEIHARGLAEVDRLHRLLAPLQAQVGIDGPPGAFFSSYAAREESRPFRSNDEILAAYRSLDAKIGERLAALFGRAPKSRLDIRAEPSRTSDSGRDHYILGTPDGERPGVFYAVIGDPTRDESNAMATLYLHEGRPGHHYQWSIAQELDLTGVQRFYLYNAFSEGWAHYAETLGYPMGLYDDTDAHVGHLRDALLRAARLVVDTGLHDRGWSRDEAMTYLIGVTGYDADAARQAIERYMAWPGQALGYAIGKKAIESLRDDAHRQLGGRFSLAAFHDCVIGSGSMPLPILREQVGRWIAKSLP